jgi:hypothetical protein
MAEVSSQSHLGNFNLDRVPFLVDTNAFRRTFTGNDGNDQYEEWLAGQIFPVTPGAFKDYVGDQVMVRFNTLPRDIVARMKITSADGHMVGWGPFLDKFWSPEPGQLIEMFNLDLTSDEGSAPSPSGEVAQSSR